MCASPKFDMSEQQTFQMEEYRSLRKEVELYLTESRTHERNTLIAVAAVWGFLLLNRNANALLWSVPILLTIASVLRMIGIYIHFARMRRYFLRVEKAFSVKGWESFNRQWWIGVTNVLLSLVLIVFSVLGYCRRVDLAGSNEVAKSSPVKSPQ